MWSNLVVTLAYKFKVVACHAHNLDLSVPSVYVYIDVLNYGCGSISRTFGVLASGCIHMHVN